MNEVYLSIPLSRYLVSEKIHFIGLASVDTPVSCLVLGTISRQIFVSEKICVIIMICG